MPRRAAIVTLFTDFGTADIRRGARVLVEVT
jgi:hypothetical protein